MTRRAAPLLLAALLLAGCQATRPAPEAPSLPLVGAENLHATLWAQTAPEFRAASLQAYAAARGALERALADSSWSADVAQLRAGGFEALPPAVILDIDETVIDNSAYQARLIRQGTTYTSETWAAWVEEEAATALPGALAFTRAADSLGLAVIYLTNRTAEEKAATRRNLEALGFPLTEHEGFDPIIARGERPEFATGDKGTRRAAVAERFRIALQVGDDLGDFLSGVDASIQERHRLADAYAGWWGERWFILPNPQYGSWERALADPALEPEERLRRKRELLDTAGR